MADPGWKVRKYRPGDEDGINELYRRAFGAPRSPQEWRWKFQEAPAEPPSLIYLAVDGHRIVGQYAVLFFRFLAGGRPVLAAQPADNMIDPDWRRGLGRSRMQRALYRAIQEDPLRAVTAFGYGFPNREHYRIGRKFLEYRDLGPVEVRHRSLTWARHVRRLVGEGRPSRVWGRVEARVRGRLLRFGHPPLNGVRVTRLERFDDRFDRLWDRVSGAFEVAAVRDRRFLQWRYGSRPACTYTILALERGPSLLGYAIVAVRAGPVRFGRVADILCLPGRGLAERLLLSALEFFLEAGCDLAECWSPSGGVYQEVFSRFFPRRIPEPVRAVWKRYDPGLEPSLFSCLSRWHVTLGDADGV